MANIQGQKKWSEVRLLETHELARGGVNGNLNEQAKALVDRTEFLNQEKASKYEIVQGIHEFDTYALFDAAKSTLPLNCTVVIGEANTTGTGQWGIGNNSWNGSVLKKSAYDPIEQAQKYVDQRAEQTLSQFIFEQKDVNNHTVFILDKKGHIYAVGLSGSLQENISNITASILKIDETVNKDDIDRLILDLKDSLSQSVLKIDKKGHIYAVGLSGSLQENISNITASINKDEIDKSILNLRDSLSQSVLKIDKKGNIYATRIQGSLQDAIIELENNTKTNIATIDGEYSVGKAVYAELPDGFHASSYKWMRDGVEISGETKSYYLLTNADLFKSISVTAGGITGGKSVHDNSAKIGGVALEEQGAADSIYEGFTLSAGDDFNTLDILAPHKPMGKWFTTRTYLYAPRGSDTLLGTMYDTDPYHTGHNDSNRGKPVGYNNMSVKNSVLTLTARKATAEEKKHFQGTSRNEVAAMISSVGAFSMYAGDLDAGDNILEWRVRYTVKDRIPNGWHPTLWTQSSLPSVTYNSNEWDIAEGWRTGTALNYNEWVNSNSRTGASRGQNPYELYDGRWHLVTAKFNHSKVEVYFDGRLAITMNRDANNFNEPAYLLVSNHIYNGNFHGDVYSKERWDALTKGATIDVDFVRLWRRSTKSHIKPLVAVNSVNVQSGAVGTITLPSKADLWGRTDVLEHVQSVMHEENEPAGSHSNDYNSLPSFVSYDSTTRTITINSADQKSGRLNFVIYGYLQDGSTSEPARTYINIGPRITTKSISLANGSKYDIYAVCDCGVLVTDGVKCTKNIVVSGLPSGAVYSDSTGFLYANAVTAGTYAVQVTCINSIGQSVTKSVSLVIS